MVKTISLNTNVSPAREVRLILPDDVPLGPADIIVVVVPRITDTFDRVGEPESITEALNRIYETESSAVDPVLARIQLASLGGESW